MMTVYFPRQRRLWEEGKKREKYGQMEVFGNRLAVADGTSSASLGRHALLMG